MEEFFKKYGVNSEHEFFAKVTGDPMFGARVASDFFYEKFPAAPTEPKVIMHPDHPHAAPERVIDPATGLDVVPSTAEPVADAAPTEEPVAEPVAEEPVQQ